MASLKETKNRIISVQNTLKITSAMKLISSAKFHQAQVAVKKAVTYEKRLNDIVNGLFQGRDDDALGVPPERTVKRIAIVPFSSDTGLCGSFNSNLIRDVELTIEKYRKEGIEVELYPVGEKIAQALVSQKLAIHEEGRKLLDKSSMKKCKDFAAVLMNAYRSGEVDKVVILYHHFKSTTRQIITEKCLIPIERPTQVATEVVPHEIKTEPNPKAYFRMIYAHVVATNLFMAVSESLVSEHAARMTAMQIATDNGNDLLKELTKIYNKTRQQAITNEILDLVGGRVRQKS
jgi:F-type H+-transporting ATPase subunit gamma